MCSRHLLLALLLALFPACSLKLNDPVTTTTASVNTGSSCLMGTGEVIEHFEAGTLTEQEHASFFSCVDRALSTFSEYTSGENREFFQPSELGNFLTKYFLKGKEIQPELMLEAMMLKQALIGGNPDRLSRGDLVKIKEFFQHLRSLTAVLRTLMPMTKDSFIARGYDTQRFEQAMRDFIEASSVFGSQMQAKQGPYSFAHMETLLRELRKFLYGDTVLPEDHWTTSAMRFSRALPPAKAIMVAPPRDEISSADWPRFYRLVPRYFAAYLRAQFFFSRPYVTLQTGGLQTIDRLFGDFMNTFEFVLNQQPGQVISSEEIDDLVVTLHNEKLMKISPDTARQFIKVIFGKLLGPSENSERFEVTKESFSHFRDNMRFLLEGLMANEAMFRAKFGDDFMKGTLTREEIAKTPMDVLLGATKLRAEISQEAVNALLKSTEIRTVFSQDEFGVVIPKQGTPKEFSYLHMLKIFSLRSLNRLLIQAYGSPKSASLSKTQVDTFINDIFPILREFRVIDEELRASISKRLFEASLFLYSSDGNRGLTMNEAIELEALLLSTLERAPKIHTKIAELCSAEKVDAKGKALIPARCYRSKFVLNVGEIWSYLPGLTAYMKGLSLDSRARVYDRMANFLRVGKAKADVTLADTQCFVQLPYYVEMLFSRFDANHDGKFDNAEAAVAYPVFRPLIAEKANAKGFTDPKDHLAIFNFLLAYQELPTDDTWTFAIRRYLLGPKEFEVDREQVVQIFEKLLAL